ncbi:glutamate--tRNA ligase [soil metagenome]
MTTSQTTRVRFCPAPSGWLHVGGARTALFNWLWARKHDGVFVLRIEDTDAERATTESAEGMIDALRWLGLDWDEGPEAGGDHGPYLQSQRRPLHEAVARRLLESGQAYEAFESPEELDAMRAQLQGAKKSPAYKTGHRDLTQEQRQAYRDQGRTPVLRIRTPDEGSVAFDDAVREQVSFQWADIGDFVISRADGSPTYMLANVVDDLAQGISFVARGEDLLSATPRQILVTELLLTDGLLDQALDEVGYAPRPAGAPDRLEYAHLPLLVGEDRKKLSKRHGDVAIDAFTAEGILPEVMVNFLALCGWSAGDDREQYDLDSLIKAFSFDRVQSSPAYFDPDKLRSLNGDAIKDLTPQEFGDRLIPAFQREGLTDTPSADDDVALIQALAPHLQERAQTLADAVPLVAFAFRDEIEWDDKAIKKWLKPAAGPVLDFVTPRLEALEDWSAEAIMAVFKEAVETLEVGMGKAMQPVRVLVTGTAVSPPLPETLEVLDKDWVLDRIRSGRDKVPDAGE